MAADYSNWSKEQLIEEVALLRKRKKYGLVWEPKDEHVVEQCKKELPVLKEVAGKAITQSADAPTNILIEGDNYHALSALNYTHKGKIDVIYIDPPYNTGAKDWKYNNNFVDSNDTFRHSKWISMMSRRLKLARDLLKKSGVILVAIDDHEVHNLRHLMDQVFQEKNYISTLCIEVNPAGQNIRENSPAISHDYCLIYAKSIDTVELILRELSEEETGVFKETDETGNFIWDNLRRRGGNSTPKDRPGQWFPLYVDAKKGKISLKSFANSTEFWPLDPKGIKRIWRVNPKGFEREYASGNISIIKKAGRFEIVKKSYEPEGRKPKTLWKEPTHSATSHGTKLLIDILGVNKFSYPKSLHLVKDCLKFWAKKDSLVLDFFAGSGTTGHAVLELNKEDSGNRHFILCTNNENDIAADVCYPRVAKVIKGYKSAGGEKVAGLGGNLRYFRTAFVGAEPNDKNKEALTRQATEMLCVREDTFEPVKETKSIKIFKNAKRYTGIVFDEDALPALKKEIAKLGGVWSVYIFSLGDDTFDDEFGGMKQRITVAPIPEAILRVYRRLF